MKTYQLEQLLLKHFNLPCNIYTFKIKDSQYLQLIALMYDYKNVADLKQQVLMKTIDYKGAIDEQVWRIFNLYGNKR